MTFGTIPMQSFVLNLILFLGVPPDSYLPYFSYLLKSSTFPTFSTFL